MYLLETHCIDSTTADVVSAAACLLIVFVIQFYLSKTVSTSYDRATIIAIVFELPALIFRFSPFLYWLHFIFSIFLHILFGTLYF